MEDNGQVTPDVEELTVQQGREMFDRLCWSKLGVSALDFISRYPNDIPDHWPCDAVVHLEILLPFWGEH